MQENDGTRAGMVMNILDDSGRGRCDLRIRVWLYIPGNRLPPRAPQVVG
jgi:hypothetical protein